MPKTSEMKTKGKFLNVEDLNDMGGEAEVTIVGVKEMNVSMEGQAEKLRWVMKVRELEQLVVLNNTNIELIERALKSDDTAEWKGRNITLYVDQAVMMGGKAVGGVRVLVPRPTSTRLPPRDERPTPEDIAADRAGRPRPRATDDEFEPPAPHEASTAPRKPKSFEDFEDDIPF